MGVHEVNLKMGTFIALAEAAGLRGKLAQSEPGSRGLLAEGIDNAQAALMVGR